MYVVICYSSKNTRWLAGAFSTRETAAECADKYRRKWQRVVIYGTEMFELAQPISLSGYGLTQNV